MNVIDIVIILLIIMSGVVGLKRGFIREIVMLIGTILIYFISYALKGPIGLLLCKILPFFKFNGLITINILVYQLIAFFLIAAILFSIFGIVLKCTGVIQKLVDLTIILTIPSKILGFIVGLVEGYIFIFIILIILSVPLRDVDLLKNSKVANGILTNTPVLSSNFSTVTNAVGDINNITNKVVSYGTSVDQINIDIMKDLIDCNIISRDDALDIIATGKLDTVSDLKDSINNYNK